jgi:pilus assembly protein CpaE
MSTPKILVLDRSEVLADQLRSSVAELSPAPEVVACARLGAVGEVLETEGPFDVLVAGPSLGTRSGLTRLRLIREELTQMSVVLAFSRRPDASLRDIVSTGAIDLLQLPVEDKELAEAVERGIELANAATIPAVAATVAVAPLAVPAPGGPGTVFTISSATGGCGKTFYATNLAYFLTKYTDKRVCIVDLDLQFGEVSTALRLRPKFTIFDALQRDDDAESTDLADHIEEYTVAHETGVHVLAAPRDPSEADRITPPDITKVLEAVRQRFDYVIVDTPPALAETVLVAFDMSDMLWVMATLDLPSVRNMSVFLSTLDRLKVPTEHVRLILNKAETDVGIDIEQVTKLFPQGFESVLPYAKEVSRSINLGMPVIAASPTAEISALMANGMKLLLPEDEQEAVALEVAPKKQSLFRRWAKH